MAWRGRGITVSKKIQEIQITKVNNQDSKQNSEPWVNRKEKAHPVAILWARNQNRPTENPLTEVQTEEAYHAPGSSIG